MWCNMNYCNTCTVDTLGLHIFNYQKSVNGYTKIAKFHLIVRRFAGKEKGIIYRSVSATFLHRVDSISDEECRFGVSFKVLRLVSKLNCKNDAYRRLTRHFAAEFNEPNNVTSVIETVFLSAEHGRPN